MDRRGIWEQRRRRLYSVVETGNVGDAFSRGYDVLLVASIVINLAVCVAYTFDSMELYAKTQADKVINRFLEDRAAEGSR